MDKLELWTWKQYLAAKQWERRQHYPNQILILVVLLVGLLIGVASAYCTAYVDQNGGIPGFPDYNP